MALAEQSDCVVLLIDDQAMVAEVVRRMLAAHADITMVHCAEPSEALEYAVTHQPTVILLDLVMPTIDGLTVLGFLRAHPETAPIPVVVLSTKEEATTKVRAFTVGASDYIVKLPDERELVARIRHHSAGFHSRRERDAAQEALHRSHEALQQSNAELQLRNRFIQETFGRYLDDDIVEELLHDPRGLDMGGQNRTVTIMMTDLRGFTALSEGLGADQVVRLLNIYLGAMADIITSHRGMINEFIGDSILAVFGVPFTDEFDAIRAVACAIDLQCAMPEINARLREASLPDVEMGIGLHTGTVIVGNIGSIRRAKYGVVGSTVNMTARIESTTVGGQILISDATLQECGSNNVIVRAECVVPAKGFHQPLVAHDVIGVRGSYDRRLPVSDLPSPTLAVAVPITLWTLQGKTVSDEVVHGTVTRLDRNIATVQCEHALAELTDVKCALTAPDGSASADLYAKITRGWDPATRTVELRFTSVPERIDSLLLRLQRM